MNAETDDNSDTFFINAARHLINVHDGNHAEWVLFRNGSLYIQTMSNNQETSSDELINKAKESLSEVVIGPGSSYGDVTVSRFNYENKKNYYISIYTFNGIIMLHPSSQVTDDIVAMIHGRTNILSDQENPVVVATGNTKQTN